MPTTTATITTPFSSVPSFSVPKRRLIIPTAAGNKFPPSSSTSVALTTKYPFLPTPPLCATSSSSSNSTSLIEEQRQQEDEENILDQSESIDSIPLGGCKACGKAEIESGCNGEGRIQGGIATVPGFGWWPIKAYRPCPGFTASGGRYRRQGQTMDEVAGFGRVERAAPKVITTDDNPPQPSKKKENPRKFKK